MDELMCKYVGKNQGYYEKKWNKKISWNWAAFFINIYWLGYRKMYPQMLMVYGTYAAVDLIMWYVDPTATYGWFGLSVCTLIGMYGNSWYKNKAEKDIQYIQSSVNPKLIEEALKKRGGTGPKGVFIAIGISLAYMIFLTYLFFL